MSGVRVGRSGARDALRVDVQAFAEETILLGLDERGAYIELQFYQWRHGGVPGDDLPAVARLLRCDLADAERIWPRLSPMFVRGADGLWRNPAVEQRRVERDTFSTLQANKGRLSAEARRVNRNSTAVATPVAQIEPEFNRAGNRGSTADVTGVDTPVNTAVATGVITGVEPRLNPTESEPRLQPGFNRGDNHGSSRGSNSVQSALSVQDRSVQEIQNTTTTDGVPVAVPGVVVTGRRHGSPANGLLISGLEYERLMRSNVYVGTRLRVPNGLHRDLVRSLGGTDPDKRLRDWYEHIDEEAAASGEPIPDVYDWLRPKFKAWVDGGRQQSAFDHSQARVDREYAEAEARRASVRREA